MLDGGLRTHVPSKERMRGFGTTAVLLAFAGKMSPWVVRLQRQIIIQNPELNNSADVYIDNIEKRSKLRTRVSSYLDSIEKNGRSSRKMPPRREEQKKKRPALVVATAPWKQKPTFFPDKKPGKTSESGQFTIETDCDQYNFTKIGGYAAVKKELTQVADMMLFPGNYTKYNVRIPRGVLLEGPPGNGKTLMSKCFAGEVKANFIRCAGSEFNEKYIGVGSSRLRELFKLATENQPSVIFIDEFDAIGRKRAGGEDTSSGERDTTLNQLLVLLDGFDKTGSVVIMAATNRIDILDSAVTRPGRFDKIIHIPNPDAEARRQIIDIHRQQKPINATTEEMMRLTTGFSGAMIENLLNEATLYGIRQKQLPLTYQDLDRIRQQMVLGGLQVVSRNISTPILRRIAAHEVGHLLNALVSDHYEKPIRVSINTHGMMSLGQTVFEREEVDDGIFIREYLDEKVRVLMGGRAAEEIVYGHSMSSGSMADLQTSFQLIKRMMMEFGMGNHIVYPFLSEDFKKRIDQEINDYIDLSYDKAKRVIIQNMIVFDTFVEELLEKGTLLEQDISEIVERHHLYRGDDEQEEELEDIRDQQPCHM